jgi:hypothetical protein
MSNDLKYCLTSDSKGKPLNGSRRYQLRLGSDMPAANFWSVILYDVQTRLIIKNGQAWPSLHRNSRKLKNNLDDSIDIWFGPKAPEGMENNWLQTIPGKEWYIVIRLYDLLEPITDQEWNQGELIEIK